MLLALASEATGASPDEAIKPLAAYKSEHARSLAARHLGQLRQLSNEIYHCLPWLEMRAQGLGFFTPRGAREGERYLSIWVRVEQEGNPQFAALHPARRASAMFSRYGVDLLRRLSLLRGLDTEPQLSGYGVVLEWLKPAAGAGSATQPVAETLAVFADKAMVHGFFAKKVPPATFAERALVTAFEGKSESGRPALEIWEDSFVRSFKPKDYVADPAYHCPAR